MKKVLFIFVLGYLMGEACQAQSYLDSLEQALAQNPAPAKRVETLNNLALYLSVEDPESAEKYAREVLKITKTRNLPSAQANALQHLGNIYLDRGNYPRAESFWEQSLELYENLGDELRVAYLMNAFGLAKYYQGEYSSALEYLKKARKIFKKFDPNQVRDGIVECTSRMGICYYAQAQYPEALKIQLETLKNIEKMEDADGRFYNQIQAFQNIGTIYMQLGETESALNYFQRAQRIARQEKDDWSRAGALTNIGAVYDEQGKYSLAKENLKKALGLFQALGTPSAEAIVLNNLGDIARKNGNFKESQAYHLRSLNIKEDLGDQRGMTASFLSLGRLYSNQKDFKQALVYFNKSLGLAGDIQATDLQKDALLAIAENYEAQDNFASAYTYFREYSDLKDSLLLATNELAEIIGQSDLRRKEMGFKIAELKREKEKVERQAQQYLIWVLLLGSGFGIFVISFMVLWWQRKFSFSKLPELEKNQT